MNTSTAICADPVILNEWHAISALDELAAGRIDHTLLLSESISYTLSSDGEPAAWRGTARDELPVLSEYGYLWTCLGEPPTQLFPMPEYHDEERRNMNAGSIVVATSAPRAVENFLDIAHFPYVHDGALGVLPHTEVVEYDVDIADGEIHATKCDFMVPQVGANFSEPQIARYRYRVPHPYCVMLYYDSLPDPSREDICGIWVQPMTDELVRVHNYMGVIDETSTDNQIKEYQLLIFSQDKPILENQYPKRLPLDPLAETPIRADKSAIAYRRWLSDLGVTYGVIPAK